MKNKKFSVLAILCLIVIGGFIFRNVSEQKWYDLSKLDYKLKTAQESLIAEQYYKGLNSSNGLIEVIDLRLQKSSESAFSADINGKKVTAQYAATVKITQGDKIIIKKSFLKFTPYTLTRIFKGVHGSFEKVKDCTSKEEQIYEKNYTPIFGTLDRFYSIDCSNGENVFLNELYKKDGWAHDETSLNAGFNDSIQYHTVDNLIHQGYDNIEIIDLRIIRLHGKGYFTIPKKLVDMYSSNTADYAAKVRLKKGGKENIAVVAIYTQHGVGFDGYPVTYITKFITLEMNQADAESIFENGYQEVSKSKTKPFGYHVYDNGRQFIKYIDMDNKFSNINSLNGII